jgi:hypothetical protein
MHFSNRFPNISTIKNMKLYAAIWSSAAELDTSSGKSAPASPRYVWLCQRGDVWVAGVESDQKVPLMAAWRRSPDGGLADLLSVSGRLSESLRKDLSDTEKTRRIWNYLENEALTLNLSQVAQFEDADEKILLSSGIVSCKPEDWRSILELTFGAN